MSGSLPSISIPVDLTNPGQFFACCGLFELADRRWPDAVVHASFTNERFVVSGAKTGISAILEQFAKADCEQLDIANNAASPIRLLAPFHLLLNWWVKAGEDQVEIGGGSQLKTWAGKQSGPLVFRLMKQAVLSAAETESPFDYGAEVFDVKGGKAKKKTISPFYFDSRREGTSLDIGFSPDEQELSVESYPVVEALAMVGLQRFRPSVEEETETRSFVYRPWLQPLPIVAAAAAVSGSIAAPSIGKFCFSKPSRGGEYLTMFSRSRRS